MTNAPRIGLLPLYVQLYDEMLPGLRGELEPFLARVAEGFRARGIDVHTAPICRVERDVSNAIQSFEQAGVDALVTLHLAYSPSLESAEAIRRTPLPVLMLDTTPDIEFGPATDPQRLLHNHGIHGLQDLASMLRRLGKEYEIVAGHLSDPRTMNRACAALRGIQAASVFRGMRVLRIGPAFPGMGDFRVSEETLHAAFGIHVGQIEPNDLLDAVMSVTGDAVDIEIADNLAAYDAGVNREVHQRSVRLGLGLRHFINAGGYGAFSMNFLSFNIESGPLSTVPFLECCNAMARGIGYAGEGDVLTAALVRALSAGIGLTTFTEMFCPDWERGAVFLSHMGEFNPAFAAATPRLYEKPFPFTKTQNPATLACAPKPGPATLVNLAPGPSDSFSLIATHVEILGDGTHPDYRDWIRGWIRPAMPLNDFLERYSYHGGTHHCALVLGHCRNELRSFARALRIGYVQLGERESSNG